MSVTPADRTPRRSPGRALLLTALGVVLAVSAAVVIHRAQPREDFGAPAVTVLASSAPSEAATRVPVVDGTVPAITAVDRPARLRIPDLRLDAAVDAVGIEPSTGEFAVPPSVDRVGWYRYGPGLFATAGSIVIAGHVDSAAEGKGAFFRLGSLDSGDRIILTGDGGEERQFEVVARERYRKTAIPLPKYFARDGAVRLTLITCGGPFDAETRHYRDNVVVTAAARP
ncbi:class F sortase [Actinoplanes ianthinogenes]|uniref:Class F sortase n=1 Tax=Actinoplanes ianthinogenes TaxID=122358 RepID=A0ABM7LPR6_9ACTN|nr:class F sortase [Actinoplanes ianthinogenes]BCJ41268.1 class F sortase [Actinoplanes ianthinogenes]GGR21781.1 class F sortase [Actinoplanes ianthinogenes]